MSDTPTGSDERSAVVVSGESEVTTGMPRWAKVFAIVAAIVLVLFLAVFLLGGGEHGPQRHGGDSGDTPSPSTSHQPPEGGHTP